MKFVKNPFHLGAGGAHVADLELCRDSLQHLDEAIKERRKEVMLRAQNRNSAAQKEEVSLA